MLSNKTQSNVELPAFVNAARHAVPHCFINGKIACQLYSAKKIWSFT